MIDIIGSYKKMVFSLKPDNLKKQLAKEKGDLKQGLIYVLLASLIAVIAGIITTIGNFAFQGVAGGAATGGAGLGTAGLGMGLGIILTVVLTPIMSVVLSLLFTAITWGIAKVLGGVGSFGNQYYHFSIVGGAIGGGIGIISAAVSIIPCLGGLVSLVLLAYSFYVAYLIYKSVHKLSSAKAAILVIIPIIIFIGLVIIAAVIFASMFATILAGMASGAGTVPITPVPS